MAGHRDLADHPDVKPLTFTHEQIDRAIAFVNATEVSRGEH